MARGSVPAVLLAWAPLSAPSLPGHCELQGLPGPPSASPLSSPSTVQGAQASPALLPAPSQAAPRHDLLYFPTQTSTNICPGLAQVLR